MTGVDSLAPLFFKTVLLVMPSSPVVCYWRMSLLFGIGASEICNYNRYSILRPEFRLRKHEKDGGNVEYSCELQLPCNAPFERIEGPLCSSMRLAQQVVLTVY